MASEGTSTVPRMGSFKRALLGYRRADVDAAISLREAQIWALERDAEEAIERARGASEAAAGAERESASLAGMVIEREREIRSLGERLREANERHDRSIASLHSVSARLDEIQRQARGQATRIRMKALREAVEVTRRTEELTEAQADAASGAAAAEPAPDAGEDRRVRLEIGPLGDFSQLVGFEDAIGGLGASDISVERFSEGRATLSMRLEDPVDRLRELEERAPFDFQIRRTSDDDLILDVDEDQGPEQHAA
jgi:chromosome segregation ATPase